MDRRRELLALINANWTTQVIHAACLLNLPDKLLSGERNLERLALDVQCHAPSLLRLLRAMASLDLCVQKDASCFTLTPLGGLLCEDDPRSLRAWALLVGGPQWSRWGELDHSVRSGISHKARHLGVEGFGDLDRNTEAAEVFHRAMVQMTRFAADAIVEALALDDATRVVDVGGGRGELLAAVLQASVSLHGVLCDLPTGTAGAPEALRRAGVDDRCEILSGDFFNGVPAGGDVYLLKSILHNWDDVRAVRILSNCRTAMTAGGRVIVIERLMPERATSCAAHRAVTRSDLNMLVALTGRERTPTEFERLFQQSGFGKPKITATHSEFVLLTSRC